MADTPAPRILFATKTAALAYVTAAVGLVGAFVPQVGAWTASHESLVLGGLSLLMLAVRTITKGSVVLFPDS